METSQTNANTTVSRTPGMASPSVTVKTNTPAAAELSLQTPDHDPFSWLVPPVEPVWGKPAEDRDDESSPARHGTFKVFGSGIETDDNSDNNMPASQKQGYGFRMTEAETEEDARRTKMERNGDAAREETSNPDVIRSPNELYKYHTEVTALGQNGDHRITEDTKLINLVRPKTSKPNGELLANLMSKTNPTQPCQININGELFPPLPPPKPGHAPHNSQGGNLRLRFNKLLMAPSVCIEFAVYDKQDPENVTWSQPYHIVSLEFPWSPDSETGNRGCIDYSTTSPPNGAAKGCYWITFYTSYAASRGFDKCPNLDDRLNNADLKLFNHLKSLIGSHDTIPLHLLVYDKPPPRNKSGVTGKGGFKTDPRIVSVQSLLPGGNGVLLPTIFNLAYSFFRNFEGSLRIAPNAMFSPAQLLQKMPPHPMMLVHRQPIFTNAQEAALVHAHYVHGTHKEYEEQLKLWASVTHKAQLFQVGHVAYMVVKFSDFPKLAAQHPETTFRLPECT